MNTNQKKNCTENITIDEFNTIFYVNNSNKINIYKKDKLIIKELELEASRISELRGSFNLVKFQHLSQEKCNENDIVAVRIRKLNKNDDFSQNNSDNEIILMKKMNDTINNILDLSEKKLHPKVYEIKVIEENSNYYLIIVMEKYETDLDYFLKNNELELRKDISHKLNPDEPDLSEKNNEIIIQLLQKTIDLVVEIANLGYFCYDIKPENIVVNYNLANQFIDVKMIDVDAEYCLKNILGTDDETKLSYFSFTKKQVYKNGMLVLLALHLYNRYNFNYLSNYFYSFYKITVMKKINTEINFENKIINLLEIIDDKIVSNNAKGELSLSSIFNNYFYSIINNRSLISGIMYFSEDFALDEYKKAVGFGLKNLLFQIKKPEMTPYFKNKFPPPLPANSKGGKRTRKAKKSKKSLIGKQDFGSWKNGSSVFKDKKGFYVVQWNSKKNEEYKKYLKNWKPKMTQSKLLLKNNKWTITKSKKKSKKNKKN